MGNDRTGVGMNGGLKLKQIIDANVRGNLKLEEDKGTVGCMYTTTDHKVIGNYNN